MGSGEGEGGQVLLDFFVSKTWETTGADFLLLCFYDENFSLI